MKKQRQDTIAEIVKNSDVETQEELREILRKNGYDVTQATVSRDIKEMKLVKKRSEMGVYRYELPDDPRQNRNIFVDVVTDVDWALNTVVIKCRNGMAQAACAALDDMNFEGIVGTIAGDDTIFALMRTENSAAQLVKTFKKLIWR